jgi:gas vesicle protein
MNDNMETRTSSNVGPTMIGFALGAVVGAGLAFLLAPESGKQMRARIAQGARRSSQLAGNAIDQARSTATDAVEQARTAVNDLSKDVVSAVQAGRETFAKERSGR